MRHTTIPSPDAEEDLPPWPCYSFGALLQAFHQTIIMLRHRRWLRQLRGNGPLQIINTADTTAQENPTLRMALLLCNAWAARTASGVSLGCAASDVRNVSSWRLGRIGSNFHAFATFCRWERSAAPLVGIVSMWSGSTRSFF